MKNRLHYLLLIVIVLSNGVLIAAQTPSEEVKTGRLVKRVSENGKDNYVYATYSFKFGGNGLKFKSFAVTIGISFLATARKMPLVSQWSRMIGAG